MRWSSVIGIVFTTVLPAADYAISPCDTLLPSWAYNQKECDKKTVQYSHDEALPRLLGGQTSLNYDMKKNDTTEAVSMSAKYSHQLFSAQIQGYYEKGRFDNALPVGNTNLSVRYRKKLWDSLALSASENVSIPVKTAGDQVDPLKYTSLLKALYPVNDVYNLFAEGSYSLLQTPSSESTAYRNPYSYTTGITYADGVNTAINASYILVQDADPTIGPNKKIKFAHKRKINKKIKTSLNVTKSLESDSQENKASFDLSYAF